MKPGEIFELSNKGPSDSDPSIIITQSFAIWLFEGVLKACTGLIE
jgi:hypothetical protein